MGVPAVAFLEDGVLVSEFTCSHTQKNVLLIGDSIRQGYCPFVKKGLKDAAKVFYFDDNCRCTQYTIFSLFGWANRFDAPELIDLVQFNCGHWDIAHWQGSEFSLTSEEEYARNLRMIIALIRKLFVNAKIVFATTTPRNPSGLVSANVRTNDEIDRYNAIAVKVCEEAGVGINDLNEYARNWDSSCYQDYCHYTNEASKLLGEEVVRRLRAILW